MPAAGGRSKVVASPGVSPSQRGKSPSSKTSGIRSWIGVTSAQVALNDTIMVVAFAPLVALLLGLSSITVPWNTLLLSVVLYIVVPVIVAQLWRRMLLAQGESAALARTLRALAPLSLSALLLTLVLLFGLQGEQIMRQPIVIALLAVPILIQVYFNAGLAYWLKRLRRKAAKSSTSIPTCRAVTSNGTGAKPPSSWALRISRLKNCPASDRRHIEPDL